MFRLRTPTAWARALPGARLPDGVWDLGSAWRLEQPAVPGGVPLATTAGDMLRRPGAGVAMVARPPPMSTDIGVTMRTPALAPRGRIHIRATSAPPAEAATTIRSPGPAAA